MNDNNCEHRRSIKVNRVSESGDELQQHQQQQQQTQQQQQQQKSDKQSSKLSAKVSPTMVLEHQGLLSTMQGPGLQPALQLYAAAAQLAPRSRVPPWAPFLQFGAPGLFGNPFLARPRFPAGTSPLNGLAAGLNGLTGISHPGISPQRTPQGPPSEDSNDDRGRCNSFFVYYFFVSRIKFVVLRNLCENQPSV